MKNNKKGIFDLLKIFRALTLENQAKLLGWTKMAYAFENPVSKSCCMDSLAGDLTMNPQD